MKQEFLKGNLNSLSGHTSRSQFKIASNQSTGFLERLKIDMTCVRQHATYSLTNTVKRL